MYIATVWNNDIKIVTDSTLFSPHHLDRGTMAMLKNVQLGEEEKVLDLGCGAGIVGISVAKILGKKDITMVDIDLKSIEISRHNAVLNQVEGIKIYQSDGFKNIEVRDFTLILSNPPYHTDFSVAKHFIEEGKKHLVLGGKMMIVVKRLDWYKNKMTSIFGGIKIIEEDGYYVLISEKRSMLTKKREDKPINKKHLKRITKSKKR